MDAEVKAAAERYRKYLSCQSSELGNPYLNRTTFEIDLERIDRDRHYLADAFVSQRSVAVSEKETIQPAGDVKRYEDLAQEICGLFGLAHAKSNHPHQYEAVARVIDRHAPTRAADVSVKRYGLIRNYGGPYIGEISEGSYVHFSDYDAVVRERDALIERCRRLENNSSYADELASALAAAQAAEARLKKVVRDADAYLSVSPQEQIGSGSVLHQQMKAALTAALEGKAATEPTPAPDGAK